MYKAECIRCKRIYVYKYTDLLLRVYFIIRFALIFKLERLQKEWGRAVHVFTCY